MWKRSIGFGDIPGTRKGCCVETWLLPSKTQRMIALEQLIYPRCTKDGETEYPAFHCVPSVPCRPPSNWWLNLPCRRFKGLSRVPAPTKVTIPSDVSAEAIGDPLFFLVAKYHTTLPRILLIHPVRAALGIIFCYLTFLLDSHPVPQPLPTS